MKKLFVISSGLIVHGKKIKIFSLLLLFTFYILHFTFFPSPTHAQIGLNITKQPSGIIIKDPKKAEETFGVVFNNALGILFTVGGLGFIIMFVWGAVDWILSGGDKEKIAAARKRIVTAVTGLVVLSLTFVVMIVLGQILGLQSLRQFKFEIPKLAP